MASNSAEVCVSLRRSISSTTKCPRVSVPVLSNNQLARCGKRIRRTGSAINTFSSSPRPSVAASVSGAASASAHGHVTTSTARACSKATAPPDDQCRAPVMAASTSTVITNVVDSRAGLTDWNGCCDWARSIRSPMRASRLSCTALFACRTSVPSSKRVPADTLSPADLCTGTDSPVRAACSTRAVPSSSSASTGMTSPWATRK